MNRPVVLAAIVVAGILAYTLAASLAGLWLYNQTDSAFVAFFWTIGCLIAAVVAAVILSD